MSEKSMPASNPTTHVPAVRSLGDFHVGASAADSDVVEVRFVLMDKTEARAWAVWLFERQEENDARQT